MLANLQVWLNHLSYHAEHPRTLPEQLEDNLSTAEQRALACSIAALQLAEQGAGRALLGVARPFAQRCELPPLEHGVQLLVREAQHHAQLLGAFMQTHEIATAPQRTSRLWQRLQHIGGFDLALGVSLNAELLRSVCYRALDAASGCERLRLLCRVLLADELARVAFQSELLLALRARRALPTRSLQRTLQRVLFATATVAAWWRHRAMLQRAGYGMGRFLQACRTQYGFYLEPAPATLPALRLP
jgi:hypothetical protein